MAVEDYAIVYHLNIYVEARDAGLFVMARTDEEMEKSTLDLDHKHSTIPHEVASSAAGDKIMYDCISAFHWSNSDGGTSLETLQ